MDHSQQPDYPELFEKNRLWAKRIEEEKPGFFRELQAQQQPKYMWIGCSDSRVPANQVIGLTPGEVFVHRNVANVVVPTDLNCLSTIQYAVDVLKVEHLMIVGHYGCGGVNAALHNKRVGLADNWLRHVKDVRDRHAALLAATPEAQREDVLCELNAIEQCMNIAHTTVLQDAWARGQKVTLHAWCYGIKDGVVHDLHMDLGNNEGLATTYKAAVEAVRTLDR